MKKAVVVHSGGMDSSICLKLAIEEFQAQNVLSLSFRFGQRHSEELEAAKKICSAWGVSHKTLPLDFYPLITESALLNPSKKISQERGESANTLVVGRNGLFARIGAILCDYLGSDQLFMGVVGLEEENSGYRDCSREYMDLLENILRIDLDNPRFTIRTPLVHMTKMASLEIAHSLGILSFLLENTISCYEGLPQKGCMICPACHLRNRGIKQFQEKYPDIVLPYSF
jgi:7-cyano-7-deazaguanine synthase